MATMPPARAKKLQEILNKVVKPKPPLEVDGLLGKNTKAAIKQLQSKAKLKQSGEIDSETAIVIARVIRTGKIEKEQPTKFFKVGGKIVGMTDKQYAALQKKFARNIRSGPLLQMKIAVEAAESQWEYFTKLNRDQWFVSFCIEVTRGADLPKRSVFSKARKAYNQCEAQVASLNIAKFRAIYPKNEKVVNDALKQMRNYRKEMIDGGENWVTGLTFTKTASFTFLAVFAAPATGAALGTGAVASAMIGGAAVSATQTAAGELGNWNAGQKGWTVECAFKNTVIDAGTGAITGFFTRGGGGGKQLLEAAAAKLAPKIAAETGFKLLSKTAAKKAAMYLLTEGAKSTVDGTVKDLAKVAKGDKKMTMDKFLDNLATNFIKGVALGPVGKVIGRFAKGAEKSLSGKDKQRIWDVVLKELSKQAKGRTIHIGDIDARAKALAEKAIGDIIGKTLEADLGVIYKNWKGPMSPAALEKKLREMMFTPARMKVYTAAVSKDVKKSLDKKKK